MERLTYTSPMGYPVSKGACAGVSCNGDCDACGIYKIICRLSAYEDTDLEPEEIKALQELAKAEKEGRAVIVPRPGDVLYETDPEHGVVKHTVTDVYWGANTSAVDDNGQTWADYYTNEDIETAHTTREAAEAVLAAGSIMEGWE